MMPDGLSCRYEVKPYHRLGGDLREREARLGVQGGLALRRLGGWGGIVLQMEHTLNFGQ